MRRIREITGLVLSAVLLAGAPGITRAADASLPQTIIPGPGVTEWQITNDGGTSTGQAFAGNCDLTPGLTIDEASDAMGDTDAYDKAYQLFVNNQVFAAPDPVDLTGNILTAGPAPSGVANLPVTVEYLFSDTLQAARIRFIFENTMGNPINIKVDVPVNLGSDNATVIEASASGDLLFDKDDRWLVTSDGTPGKPVNTTVLYGTGTPPAIPTAATGTVFTCGDNGEGAGITFNIEIPANSMRSLMFFAGLGDIVGQGNTIAGAIANVGMFDDPATIDDSLVGDLSNIQWDETLNWRFIREGAVGVGGDGGGGGCMLQPAGPFDPLFPALLAGLLVLLNRKHRNCATESVRHQPGDSS
jgi:hypothetical protein